MAVLFRHDEKNSAFDEAAVDFCCSSLEKHSAHYRTKSVIV